MKNIILALLAEKPAHGYELKQAYDDLFGAIQAPLNAGQIYTTLGRLEKDGLVEQYEVVEQNDRPNKKMYQITVDGIQHVTAWLVETVQGPYLKDEFFSKMMLAYQTGIMDAHELIRRQRQTYLQNLKQLNEMALQCQNSADKTSYLLIEGAIYHVEADLKWLDVCEIQLDRG